MPDTHSRKPVIGLVGGIGSGKSSVARQFASLGCAVIDADELARIALAEPQVVRQIVEWWGSGVLAADGSPDRSAIGRIVFEQPDELKRLEGLIHPKVHAQRKALRQRYQADPSVVAIVEDCPLLLETGLAREVDTIVFVDTPREVRLERLARSRGWSEAELSRREKNQLPLDIKAQAAEYSVDNGVDADKALLHVGRVLSRILQAPDQRDRGES